MKFLSTPCTKLEIETKRYGQNLDNRKSNTKKFGREKSHLVK
jgi:hypothetical protein